jgi:hypothetical protein
MIRLGQKHQCIQLFPDTALEASSPSPLPNRVGKRDLSSSPIPVPAQPPLARRPALAQRHRQDAAVEMKTPIQKQVYRRAKARQTKKKKKRRESPIKNHTYLYVFCVPTRGPLRSKASRTPRHTRNAAPSPSAQFSIPFQTTERTVLVYGFVLSREDSLRGRSPPITLPTEAVLPTYSRSLAGQTARYSRIVKRRG